VKGEYLRMTAALCALSDAREAALMGIRTMQPPGASEWPPREVVEAPIWTTWARYHSSVSQAKARMRDCFVPQ
jgi:myogenesis-regulating glycosidase